MARKTKDKEVSEPEGDGLLIAGALEPSDGAPKAYTVLARRYRSRSFDELIGQESIARTLQNAIAMGRTAHAYLFCGTRGVGKTSMARVFARALNAGGDLHAPRGFPEVAGSGPRRVSATDEDPSRRSSRVPPESRSGPRRSTCSGDCTSGRAAARIPVSTASEDGRARRVDGP